MDFLSFCPYNSANQWSMHRVKLASCATCWSLQYYSFLKEKLKKKEEEKNYTNT